VNRRALVLGGGAVLVAGGAAAVSFVRMGSLEAYAETMARQRASLSAAPDLKELVRYATLAANGHNTQPWRFRVGADSIAIEPDMSRRTPVVDPDDHHLFASLGCAAENLSHAAAASGRRVQIGFENDRVLCDLGDGPPERSVLFEAIPHRQSTRAAYDGRAVPVEDLKTLEAAAQAPDVAAVIVTDPGTKGRVRDLVVAGNTRQMADAAFVAELKRWMRFNPRTALDLGDGIFSAASGNPTFPTWLGSPLFDLVFTPSAENEKYVSHIDSSAGLIVFLGANATPENWVKVGQACQRFALQATALGVKHAFVNQPVEVPELRADLASLVGLGNRRPDIVMRFGYGPDLPKSARRPVEDVLA
jgi:nitroreductase